MSKRILYPLTKSIRMWDIPYALKIMGHEPLLADLPCDSSSSSPEDTDTLIAEINNQHAEAVITHDFSPYAAMACESCGIPYIAWIWDSPQDVLYDDSIKLSHNYIFDFDAKQAEETARRGAPFVRHMPLAGNVNRIEQLEITGEDERRYDCGISFVGSIYGGPEWRFDMERLSTVTEEKLEGIIQGTIGHFDGQDRLTDAFADMEIHEIAGTITDNPYIRSVMGEKNYLEQVRLPRHIAGIERREMLSRLAIRGIRLYTWNRESTAADIPPGVQVMGQLDYVTELPKACFFSRINLNMTLRSIRSGVPLRVFEIMAAGGFVLTNYQPELEELFSIGEDLEIFRSFEELEDKADYYLRNEEARLKITLNGHRRVRDEHSYEKRLKEMLNIVFGGGEK